MKILITGGAGFIGSHLVDALIAGGHRVAVIDDLSSGRREHVHPEAAFHQLDVAGDDLAPAFAGEPFDAVVHLAAQIKVHLSMRDPRHDLRVNVLGTQRLIETARERDARRFVFLSTGGALYGETPTPATEATLPSPRSYYGVHKLAAEYYVALSGLPYAVLRPSNVYGPRQRDDLEGGVVAVFVQQLLTGRPVEIFGDGEQTRDFVYVDDVVRAITHAIGHPRSGVWNIGTGQAVTINGLLEALAAHIAAPVGVRHVSARPGDLTHSCLNAGQAARDGLWTPEYDLDGGIAAMMAIIRTAEPAAPPPAPPRRVRRN